MNDKTNTEYQNVCREIQQNSGAVMEVMRSLREIVEEEKKEEDTLAKRVINKLEEQIKIIKQ